MNRLIVPESVSTPADDTKKDIAVAVLQSFKLMDEMNGYQKNLLDIISFGRDLYCKKNPDSLELWPKTWSSCCHYLLDFGYKEPTTYFICLNAAHHNLWSRMSNSTDMCKYCQKPGSIQYHYLPLCYKVQRWCSNAEFCEKMTAHWLQKDKWMHHTEHGTMHEIWDGERFAE